MDFSYSIVRSRRKTVAIQITPAGEVILRCPLGFGTRAAKQFLESKRPWIEGHLARIRADAPGEKLSRQALQSLAEAAARELPERVRRWAPVVGVDYGRITVRCQRTRWGSCSTAGNLSLNCLLQLAPEAARDYVVVHELCHRKEMNHSPAFWALVEQALPTYREGRAWLKAHGGSLLARVDWN